MQLLDEAGTREGLSEHLLGLMPGEGFGPRLSRMSDDFWCHTGNCCQGNWFCRDSAFLELPITFSESLPTGFMSCFLQVLQSFSLWKRNPNP